MLAAATASRATGSSTTLSRLAVTNAPRPKKAETPRLMMRVVPARTDKPMAAIA